MEEKRRKTKRFCSKGHDTYIVGRYKNYDCRQCRKERKRYSNMTEEKIELARAQKRRTYNRTLEDPIKKLRKQTLDRIKRIERKL